MLVLILIFLEVLNVGLLFANLEARQMSTSER